MVYGILMIPSSKYMIQAASIWLIPYHYCPPSKLTIHYWMTPLRHTGTVSSDRRRWKVTMAFVREKLCLIGTKTLFVNSYLKKNWMSVVFWCPWFVFFKSRIIRWVGFSLSRFMLWASQSDNPIPTLQVSNPSKMPKPRFVGLELGFRG